MDGKSADPRKIEGVNAEKSRGIEGIKKGEGRVMGEGEGVGPKQHKNTSSKTKSIA